MHLQYVIFSKSRGKAISIQAWTSPEGYRRLRLPEFPDNRKMKVEKLSAVRTGRLYSPGDTPGTHLLVDESTPGPQCGRNLTVIKPATFRLVALCLNPVKTRRSGGITPCTLLCHYMEVSDHLHVPALYAAGRPQVCTRQGIKVIGSLRNRNLIMQVKHFTAG
jgi:hypothetical protein